MVPLGALWLPILVATVLVFVAAAVAWTVLPHHDSDWVGLPEEERVREALRDVGRGQYRFPAPGPGEEWGSAELEARAREGPAGFLVVVPPGGIRMGRALVQTFVHYLLISVLVAYLAGRTLGPGAEYLAVFRVVGTGGILAHVGALFGGAIWFGRTWSSVVKEAVDGVVYGLLMAGAFGWLWPG